MVHWCWLLCGYNQTLYKKKLIAYNNRFLLTVTSSITIVIYTELQQDIYSYKKFPFYTGNLVSL